MLASWAAQDWITGIAVALAVLGTLVVWRQWRGVPLLQYLSCLRFQIVQSVVLLALPLAVHTSIFGNLFHLESGADVGLVVTITYLVAWQIMVMVVLVLQWAPTQLGVRTLGLPRWLIDRRVVVFGSLGAPMIVVLLLSADLDPWRRVAGLVVGVAAAFGILWLTTFVHAWLSSPRDTPSPLLLASPRWVWQQVRRSPAKVAFRVPAWMARVFGPGIVAAAGGVQYGFGLALSLFLASWVLYLAGYWLLNPLRPLLFGLTLPGLAYILIVVLAAGWLLMLAAFWLDRYRVPVGVFVAALVLITFVLARWDDFFVLSELPARLEPPSVAATLERWLAPSKAGVKPVVVVATAAGGGIRASAWAALVLTQLQAEIPELLPSVRLISSVSGGAVGTMYVLDSTDEWAALRSSDTAARHGLADRVYERASASSLTALAWGAVYPDLSRTIGGGLVNPVYLTTPRIVDRGWMLEQRWEQGLRRNPMTGRPPMLSEWTERVTAGRLPPFIFNATAVESGERILLGAVRLARENGSSPLGARHFADLYDRRDIAMATAARLSATFSYVSPVARALTRRPDGRLIVEDQSDHLADGGYHDNFGVTTAIDWLREALRLHHTRIRAVVLIRIQLEPSPEPGGGDVPAIVYEAIAPLRTLVAVRGATQTSRNAVALSLLRGDFRGVRFCDFLFMPTPSGSQTLSWHLTTAERDAVRREWNPYRDYVPKIRAWVTGGESDCPWASE